MVGILRGGFALMAAASMIAQLGPLGRPEARVAVPAHPGTTRKASRIERKGRADKQHRVKGLRP